MADTFDVVVQVYDDVSGELKGDANVKTSAGMTYFSDGESLQEKVDSGEFTSGEQGPEGPPGPNSADLITVVDTEGLLGTPGTTVMTQNLMDEIVDRVMNRLLSYEKLANNGLTTEEGFALDARYGKTLKELFDGLNSNLGSLVANVSVISDCNDPVKSYGVSILRWNAETLNTPYKQEQQGTDQGYILDFSIDITYRTQIAIRAGLNIISVRAGTSTGWSNWLPLAIAS